MNAYDRVGPPTGSRFRLVIPVLLVVAAVGVSLLANAVAPGGRTSPAEPSGPPAEAATAPSPGAPSPASPAPTQVAQLPICFRYPTPAPLAAGRHDVMVGALQVTVTMPDGWSRLCSEPGTWVVLSEPESLGRRIGFALADAIPCYGRPPLAGTPVPESDRAVVRIGDYELARLELRPDSACHPHAVLDALHDPAGRGPEAHLTLWILETTGPWLAAYTVASGGDRDGQELLRTIVESAHISPLPEAMITSAGPPMLPPSGMLDPGFYLAAVDSGGSTDCCPDGFTFSFHLPSARWTSLGPGRDGLGWAIATGAPGASDGAIVRFGNTERVFADPCGHVLGPPLGPSVDDLALALTAIPGTNAGGPWVIPLRSSTAVQIVVTPGTDLRCDPRVAALWVDRANGTRVPSAPDSTFRVWMFEPNDRSVFGRVVIEAETFGGVSAELESEIRHIVDSIGHGG